LTRPLDSRSDPPWGRKGQGPRMGTPSKTKKTEGHWGLGSGSTFRGGDPWQIWAVSVRILTFPSSIGIRPGEGLWPAFSTHRGWTQGGQESVVQESADWSGGDGRLVR